MPNIQVTEEPAIEVALRKLQNVRDCVVLDREGPGGTTRVAYVVTTGPFSTSAAETKTAEAGTSAPQAYVPVTRLPYDDSGRIDVAQLARVPVCDDLAAEAFEAAASQQLDVAAVVAFTDDFVDEPVLHLSQLPAGIDAEAAPALAPDEQASAGAAVLDSRELGQAATSTVLAESHGAALSFGPDAPITITDALVRAAQSTEGAYLHYLKRDGSTKDDSFADLLAQAKRVAAALARQGVEVGSKVMLQLSEPAEIIPAFWGCVVRGCVPAMAGVPPSYAEETSELERLCHVWQLLESPPFITSRAMRDGMRALESRLGISSDRIFVIEDLLENDEDFVPRARDANAPAFFVTTSGSTGMPKVIALSHRNMLTRSQGTNELNRHESSDRILNWLPFDHIGSISDWHVRCVDLRCHMFYCTKEFVLGDPLNWLRLMDRFEISHSWAPNFAYALVNDAHKNSTEKFRLASVKALLTAGEAVSSNTVRDFLKRLAPDGMAATAMRPAFGMAELGSGVTYFQPTPEQPIRLETIDRRTLDGALSRTDPSDPQALSFPSLGPIIPGASMRVVDEAGQVVPEMSIGKLQIAGGPVCLEYYKNPEANREVFVGDGWFNTGDRAFLSQGELFLAGRDKETLIVNGANFHNSEIESAAEEVKGVRVSFTAACAVRPPGQAQERLAIFVCPVVREAHQLQSVLREVQNSVAKRTGVKPDYLIPVETGDIPKTAIGKIQRKQLVKRFEAAEFADAIRRADTLLQNERTLNDWFLSPTWLASALAPAPLQSGSELLVIGNGAGLASEIARLAPGTKLAESDADLERALNDSQFRSVIDLTGYATFEAKSTENPSSAASGLAESCMALVQRMQRLVEARREGQGALRYLVAASRSQCVPWLNSASPVKAALPALLRAANQELTEVDCSHVDLPEPADGAQLSAVAENLLRELAAPSVEPEVAYDASQRRMVRGFARVSWEGVGPSALVPHGLYLVTGGLGGVGSELVRTLLSQGPCSVLLVGRTEIDVGAGDHASPGDHKSKRLRELSELGPVRYRAIDVCDGSALETIVAEFEAEFGRKLDGVFHLAGVYAEVPLAQESLASLTERLSPKVDGALALFDVVARRSHAFVVSFSSLASVFSGSGLGSYAVANRFLDVLSETERRQNQRRAFVFNWSVWKGLGIGADSAPASILRVRGYVPVPPKPGMLSLLAALHREPGQLLIGVDPASPALQYQVAEASRATRQLYAAIEVRKGADPEAVMAAVSRTLVSDRFGNPISAHVWWLPQTPLNERGEPDRAQVRELLRGAASVVVAPKTGLEKQLASIWKDVLGLEVVGTNQSFFDLGGTSLLSVRLFSNIEREFGVSLQPAVLFKASTVAAIAKVLVDAGVHVQDTESEDADSRRTPLFLVHDGEGDAGDYRSLGAALTSSHELVVLHALGKERVPTLQTHLEDILSHYEQQVRKRAPHGPYAIAGRGAGSLIALEVACRLQQAGETVDVLAMFDPVLPAPNGMFGAARLFESIQFDGDLRNTLRGARAALTQTTLVVGKRALERGRFELLRYYTDNKQDPPWFLEHIPLATVYRCAGGHRSTSRFRGRLRVFRTELNGGAGAESQSLGAWDQLASDGVSILDVGPVFGTELTGSSVQPLVDGLSSELDTK